MEDGAINGRSNRHMAKREMGTALPLRTGNPFAERLPRLEVGPMLGRHEDLLPRFWVASHARRKGVHTEAPEIPNFNPAAIGEGGLHGLQNEADGQDGRFLLEFREAFSQPRVQIRFKHDRILPKTCCGSEVPHLSPADLPITDKTMTVAASQRSGISSC